MTTYTVTRNAKEVRYESYDMSHTIISTESREEAEKAFNEQKAKLQQMAEENRLDYELTLWEGDEDDPCYDALEEAYADYQGENTDSKVAMVIKPKHYYTPYQVVSGEGHNERYFADIEDGIRVELIEKSELTAEALKKFGFPQWFVEDYSIDADMM